MKLWKAKSLLIFFLWYFYPLYLRVYLFKYRNSLTNFLNFKILQETILLSLLIFLLFFFSSFSLLLSFSHSLIFCYLFLFSLSFLYLCLSLSFPLSQSFYQLLFISLLFLFFSLSFLSLYYLTKVLSFFLIHYSPFSFNVSLSRFLKYHWNYLKRF